MNVFVSGITIFMGIGQNMHFYFVIYILRIPNRVQRIRTSCDNETRQ